MNCIYKLWKGFCCLLGSCKCCKPCNCGRGNSTCQCPATTEKEQIKSNN